MSQYSCPVSEMLTPKDTPQTFPRFPRPGGNKTWTPQGMPPQTPPPDRPPSSVSVPLHWPAAVPHPTWTPAAGWTPHTLAAQHAAHAAHAPSAIAPLPSFPAAPLAPLVPSTRSPPSNPAAAAAQSRAQIQRIQQDSSHFRVRHLATAAFLEDGVQAVSRSNSRSIAHSPGAAAGAAAGSAVGAAGGGPAAASPPSAAASATPSLSRPQKHDKRLSKSATPGAPAPASSAVVTFSDSPTRHDSQSRPRPRPRPPRDPNSLLHHRAIRNSRAYMLDPNTPAPFMTPYPLPESVANTYLRNSSVPPVIDFLTSEPPPTFSQAASSSIPPAVPSAHPSSPTPPDNTTPTAAPPASIQRFRFSAFVPPPHHSQAPTTPAPATLPPAWAGDAPHSSYFRRYPFPAPSPTPTPPPPLDARPLSSRFSLNRVSSVFLGAVASRARSVAAARGQGQVGQGGQGAWEGGETPAAGQAHAARTPRSPSPSQPSTLHHRTGYKSHLSPTTSYNDLASSVMREEGGVDGAGMGMGIGMGTEMGMVTGDPDGTTTIPQDHDQHVPDVATTWPVPLEDQDNSDSAYPLAFDPDPVSGSVRVSTSASASGKLRHAGGGGGASSLQRTLGFRDEDQRGVTFAVPDLDKGRDRGTWADGEPHSHGNGNLPAPAAASAYPDDNLTDRYQYLYSGPNMSDHQSAPDNDPHDPYAIPLDSHSTLVRRHSRPYSPSGGGEEYLDGEVNEFADAFGLGYAKQPPGPDKTGDLGAGPYFTSDVDLGALGHHPSSLHKAARARKRNRAAVHGAKVVLALFMAAAGFVAIVLGVVREWNAAVEAKGRAAVNVVFPGGGTGAGTGTGTGTGTGAGNGGGTSATVPYANITCPWIPDANLQARLQPPVGVRMSGFSLNWQHDSPVALTARLGFRPSIVGAFAHVLNSSYERDILFWYAGQLQAQAKASSSAANGSSTALSLALMPDVGLENVAESVWQQVADDLKTVNYGMGVPVFLRFAHEMNGNWVPYGQRPLQFVKTWRLLASLVRSRTNLTAMVWAPNMGAGYPFGSSVYTPKVGSDEYNATDTNRDGRITVMDDPYGPYWPGRDWVDWVGISIYWFGNTFSDAVSNILPPTDYVSTIAFGNSSSTLAQNATIFDFYTTYAVNQSLPMMLPESGALFYYSDSKGAAVPAGVGEMEMKKAFWKQTWVASGNGVPQMPLVRAVVNFEEAKLDSRGNGTFQLTFNETIRASFLADVAADLKIGPSTLVYYCDGKIQVV
ncbi:hypothetical protein HDU93_007111 [Gonapodya sp. JEL0774]|nr:hypothetical protein HDU93_007111 [Gonapodya sp. JEL0774]